MKFFLVTLVFLIASIEAIDWHYTDTGAKWSYSCNINDSRDLLNVTLTRGEECSGICYATCKCTHFVWSNNVCWLKHGTVNETSEVQTTFNSNMICGISAKPGGSFFKCMKQSLQNGFKSIYRKINDVVQ